VIRGRTDAEGRGNRSDPNGPTLKALAPSDPPIESALVQSQGARWQGLKEIPGRKLESIVVPPESTDLNRSVHAWRARGETMIRGKPGEGLRGDHRKGKRPTTVDPGGPNSPRVLSDREGNLEDLPPPIRNRIASRLPVGPEKGAAGATVAIRGETETKGIAIDKLFWGRDAVGKPPLAR
jgi:hypothetical protein